VGLGLFGFAVLKIESIAAYLPRERCRKRLIPETKFLSRLEKRREDPRHNCRGCP
jgi:hypothetical protein